MPFEETHVMDQRRRFIEDAHCSLQSFSELCRHYGISRKTGYKWLDRWLKANSKPATAATLLLPRSLTAHRRAMLPLSPGSGQRTS
jgi:transposase-like protein